MYKLSREEYINHMSEILNQIEDNDSNLSIFDGQRLLINKLKKETKKKYADKWQYVIEHIDFSNEIIEK